MIRALPFAAVLLAATQAAALSCVPPNPFQSFRMAHEAPETYVVLHGRLDFDPAAMQDATELPPPGAGETSHGPVEARFEGFALGVDGFTRPVTAPVLLRPICLGQFCGSIGPGEGWLLFAQPSEAGGYSVDVDPCGAWTFDRVFPAALDGLAGCLRGEACVAP